MSALLDEIWARRQELFGRVGRVNAECEVHPADEATLGLEKPGAVVWLDPERGLTVFGMRVVAKLEVAQGAPRIIEVR